MNFFYYNIMEKVDCCCSFFFYKKKVVHDKNYNIYTEKDINESNIRDVVIDYEITVETVNVN